MISEFLRDPDNRKMILITVVVVIIAIGLALLTDWIWPAQQLPQ